MSWGGPPELQNARIRSTSLGPEDHGIMTCMIHLEYAGGGQGFGGYALVGMKHDEKKPSFDCGGWFIKRVLETLDVRSWEKLPGTYVRVYAEHTKVHRIGHIVKDQWFDPGKELAELGL